MSCHNCNYNFLVNKVAILQSTFKQQQYTDTASLWYLPFSTKFWQGEISTLSARPSKFNPSNCLKTIQRLQVYSERQTVTIHQNIFRQIFEESVSVKISPRQNFTLYGI